MTLDQLKEGQIAVIFKVKGRGAFRQRLLEMGFVKGRVLRTLRFAPMKDPVEFRLLDADISLRRSEAAHIEITLLENEWTENEKFSDRNCQSGMNLSASTACTSCSKTCTIPSAIPNVPEVDSPCDSCSKTCSVSVGDTLSDVIDTPSFESIVDTVVSQKTARLVPEKIEVCMVGNPNAGKTSLFNALTGENEHVGNYSGVTVDAKTSLFTYANYQIKITDLPGSYSLSPYTPEENFVRTQLLTTQPDLVINVVDASNLERNLYLTSELIDMDIKVVIALNMYDELEKRGDELDYLYLGKLLGIPIIPTVASKGKGMQDLMIKVLQVYNEQEPTVRHTHIPYPDEIETSIRKLQDKIRKHPDFIDVYSSRYLSVKLLEEDDPMLKLIPFLYQAEDIKQVANLEISRLHTYSKDDIFQRLSDARYAFIRGALKESYRRKTKDEKSLSVTDKIDKILMHKWWGFPIFLGFLWLMFQSTFVLGEYPMLWIEKLVASLSETIQGIMKPSIFKDLLIDGILQGIGGVIIFLPNILILFFFIALMEATGYMARVAFIMDKLMHTIGLHGKSFIPLIIGFGCNVPAIMATRTIENRKDRILTMMIIPFMSCSARLPVYILIAGAFFPKYAGTLIFCIYLVGVAFSILSALFLKPLLFKSAESPFVMEFPPYRLPTVFSVLRHLWVKAQQYIQKMGGLILIASVIIWALGYFPLESHAYPPTLEAVTEAVEIHGIPAPDPVVTQIEASYLGKIGKFIDPVLKPLGFDWKMGIALLAGVAAKEVVVSTMSVMFTPSEAFTPLTAISFLAFVLLYFPCLAVFAAVKKESSWKWAVFLAFYTTALAWLVSFLIFQLGSL